MPARSPVVFYRQIRETGGSLDSRKLARSAKSRSQRSSKPRSCEALLADDNGYKCGCTPQGNGSEWSGQHEWQGRTDSAGDCRWWVAFNESSPAVEKKPGIFEMPGFFRRKCPTTRLCGNELRRSAMRKEPNAERLFGNRLAHGAGDAIAGFRHVSRTAELLCEPSSSCHLVVSDFPQWHAAPRSDFTSRSDVPHSD